MHAFLMYPRVHMSGQWRHEWILFLLRQAPITQFGWIAMVVFYIICLVALNFILPYVLNEAQMLFFNIFGLALILSYGWLNYLMWYYNVGIVTNMRVIDMDLNGLLNREDTQAELKQITEVTSKIVGFLPSFFNYGNVFVKTFGFEQNIEFHRVPDPNTVVNTINNLLRHLSRRPPSSPHAPSDDRNQ